MRRVITRSVNLSIRLKVFMAPVLAIASMLAMGVAGQLEQRQQALALDELANVSMVRSSEAAATDKAATEAHLMLLRTVTWAANSNETEKIKASVESVRAHIGQVTAFLAGLPQHWHILAGDADLTAATAALETYGKSVGDVLDMVDADPATALIFMLDAENTFAKVSATLSVLHTRQAKDAEATVEAAFRAGQRATVLSLSLLGGALTLAVFVTVLVGRSIARPISGMTAAMRTLAAGDLGIDIPGTGRGDEIGTMAAAVQVFKDNALRSLAAEREEAEARQRRAAEDDRLRQEIEKSTAAEAAGLVVGSIGEGLKHLAAGDLTYRLDTALPTAYEPLRGDLNAAMTALQDLVRGIVANSSGISSNTSEITHASDDLSRRTENQAATLEQTAAALDQITATVRKTAQGAQHASNVVSKAGAEAELSGEVVRQAIAAMGSIERSSEQIGQIIGLIDEIAFQTSLLALNAGIEAARAGDAGLGFAVVASEVRALAQRSAQAAKEIKSLISTSVQQVGSGVALVSETGLALTRIVSRVSEITTVVSEIAASAQEQAAALDVVNTAINHMDQATQQNAAMVEQSTAACHSLGQEITELGCLIERFQIDCPSDGGAASVIKSNAGLAMRAA